MVIVQVILLIAAGGLFVLLLILRKETREVRQNPSVRWNAKGFAELRAAGFSLDDGITESHLTEQTFGKTTYYFHSSLVIGRDVVKVELKNDPECPVTFIYSKDRNIIGTSTLIESRIFYTMPRFELTYQKRKFQIPSNGNIREGESIVGRRGYYGLNQHLIVAFHPQLPLEIRAIIKSLTLIGVGHERFTAP